MYEFVLPEAELNPQKRSATVPYQQVTETLKQEVNVSTGTVILKMLSVLNLSGSCQS